MITKAQATEGKPNMGPQQVRTLSTAQEAGLWKSVGSGETAVSHIPDSHTEHRRHLVALQQNNLISKVSISLKTNITVMHKKRFCSITDLQESANQNYSGGWVRWNRPSVPAPGGRAGPAL